MNHKLVPSPSANSTGIASFRIVVQMDARHISPARRVVADIGKSIGLPEEIASRLALAAHELLENAVKYALNPDRPVLLRLSIVMGSKARVTVSNISNRAIFQRMRRRLQRLNQSPDANAMYQTLIGKSARRKTGSGLGLARIRAEAEMKLYCAFRDDMLSVRAEVTTGAAQ